MLLPDNEEPGNAVSYGTHTHCVDRVQSFAIVTFLFGRTNQLQSTHYIVLLTLQSSFRPGGALVKAKWTGRQLLMAPRKEREGETASRVHICSHPCRILSLV